MSGIVTKNKHNFVRPMFEFLFCSAAPENSAGRIQGFAGQGVLAPTRTLVRVKLMRGLILLTRGQLRPYEGLIMSHECFTAGNNPIEHPLTVWRVEEDLAPANHCWFPGSRLVALSNQVDFDQIHHSVNFEAK